MAIDSLLPFFVVLPLGGAFLIALLGRKIKIMPEVFGVLIPLLLFALAMIFLRATHSQAVVCHALGGWKAPLGISLVADGLTTFMLVIVQMVTIAIAVYSISYMERYTSPWIFYTLFLLVLSGMNGVLITGDLFNLFVFMEIASLSACALVAFGTERHELEAAFKYGLMNAVGALFILLGIALLYGAASTLNMADMAQALAAGSSNRVVILATILLVTGFGLKAALVPFHAWLPDAHPSAPAPISAMLSGLIIKSLGIYALFRILFSVLGANPSVLSALLFLGALSMAVGAFMALGQTDLKRLLAYSSLSQIGYIVFGIGLGTPWGVLGGLLHLFNHSVAKSLLFLSAGAVEYATGTRDINQMGGLSKKMNVTGSSTLVGVMSISGIPPFGGFFSKLIIIFAAVQAGRWGYALWAVGAGVLTLSYLMKTVKKVFKGDLPERLSAVEEVPLPMKAAMAALALLCLAGGLLLVPQIKILFLSQASKVLLAGTSYSKILGAP